MSDVPNLIYVIAMCVTGIFFSIIFSHTIVHILEMRTQAIKGNLDAVKLLRQIKSGTYREEEWL